MPPKSKEVDFRPFMPDKLGTSDVGIGVEGISNSGTGVEGESTSGTGVYGHSTSDAGVYGESHSGVGVWGQSDSSRGVEGHSTSDLGVAGFSQKSHGVYGHSTHDIGVLGEAPRGVVGISNGGHGTEGFSTNGVGIWGESSNGEAGHFEGIVRVTGDIELTGGDCAEEFDISEATDVEPGTVMVLDQEGTLQPSRQAYDKKVAGVISGAGDYKPGLVLDRQQSSENRMPVALVGKVYCKADAQYGSIEVGDLLTTSDTLGYAMKADDPLRAFGAVIGKALRPLREGQGLIPILIALQ